MKHSISKLLLTILFSILLGSSIASAQDFNPTNPPEPDARYKLTVNVSPEGVGKASGTGRYASGTRVYVNTSASDTDYAFKRWEKNGQTISTSRSFYYTTGTEDETLTAVYEYVIFNPDSPAEPSEGYKWHLYLDCDPAEGCSFNLNNGSRHLEGESFNVIAYPSQGFVFDGWFDGETKISDSLTLPYKMPGRNAALTARFTFLPDSPDEPQGGNQSNVDNTVKGDVNGDGIVNVTDATTVIAHYLAEQPYNRKYDINGDGIINVTDATIIISIFLTEK